MLFNFQCMQSFCPTYENTIVTNHCGTKIKNRNRSEFDCPFVLLAQSLVYCNLQELITPYGHLYNTERTGHTTTISHAVEYNVKFRPVISYPFSPHI